MSETKHKSIRNNIKNLVDNFPELAENYNALCGAYWILFDDCTNISDIKLATPSETITRNLRRLVETGLVTLPKRVEEARKEKEVEFRNEFSPLT